VQQGTPGPQGHNGPPGEKVSVFFMIEEHKAINFNNQRMHYKMCTLPG